MLEKEQYEEMEGCYKCFDETRRAWTRPILIKPKRLCEKHTPKEFVGARKHQTLYLYKALIRRAEAEEIPWHRGGVA